jgi:hypothetical protein
MATRGARPTSRQRRKAAPTAGTYSIEATCNHRSLIAYAVDLDHVVVRYNAKILRSPDRDEDKEPAAIGDGQCHVIKLGLASDAGLNAMGVVIGRLLMTTSAEQASLTLDRNG